MTRIAITGATGFVGQALVDRALAEGFIVQALTRREQPKRQGVTWVQGDLADIRALARLMKGAECVIHPGGSMRDDEVIAAADERGIAMVLTGVRHFRH